MDAQARTPERDAERDLIAKLKTLRNSMADQPAAQIRQALRQALREHLAALPETEAGQKLERLRDSLVLEAREREQRLQDLEAETRRLSADLEALRAERGRLEGENARLQAGAASGPPQRAGGEVVDGIRAGLLKTLEGGEAAPESLGLPAEAARFFVLAQELLRFCLAFEKAVARVQEEIGAGPQLGTMGLKRQTKIVRDRFRACLENREGSIEALREILNHSKGFIVDLHSAYEEAIRQGSRALLTRFEPQEFIQESTGALGIVNYEKAFKQFSGLHADLSTLPSTDLWERFFQEPFNRKIAGAAEGGS